MAGTDKAGTDKGISKEFSRRGLLQTAAGVAGAAAVLGAGITAAKAAKLPKASVGYKDAPNGDKRCETCSNFRAPNGCATADGDILANGYCNLFVAKA